ncbi:Tripartite-type tricarboxylate transporter, receptor component TctC [Variovorax sp. OK605]|jgi:tripartite-type tricarboxylate transporter receptor subunit TctC|uniref:Bug family tripartite tricarboxylate transporter substrate binding protein n=1 Tax=unclassified Variovorax TaxID=663243 RepID=UPI0008C7F69C|nr:MULTISPECIES: tripartite tricarboxylate transporter substrate binding protein [unclassified Variovorax]SEJ28247.1 Tripartite-type tricarboxylate transporter, receptor component TctC [Variovorax sp. OK202]SFC21466.1 Tripartite-type tricarboxylate transporter, receptor component TctC [Variovorax sp. OK212]SFO77354.1 Tripartite-type tricarboxylate transporter, receptor component TctC [Variovorax sp. OK605]
MSINRRGALGAALATTLAASLPVRALAQASQAAQGAQAGTGTWPSKPIKIIVPYPPGGSSDIIARAISQPLSEALGQSVIIDNRAGANGNLGADLLAKAPADGYTLMLCDMGALAISPSLYPKLPFDPSKDLRSVSMLAYSPHLLVVHPSVQANTLKELVELSKKSDFNFAVTASGSTAHLAGIELQRKIGAKWEYVPYKGGVQAVLDTVAGQTQVLMNGMLATYPQVQAGKLKLIAVSKATRMPLIGSVPTIAEQGAPGYESGTWQGVVAARGVPDAVIARLNRELVRIIRTPDIRARLAGQGAEVVTMTVAEQDQFFAKERARWAQVIKEANVKLD